MLPIDEIDTFTTTVADAIDRAAEGDVAGGYTALLAGLRRAEGLAVEGPEWAPELVARWKLALDNYASRYRVGRA